MLKKFTSVIGSFISNKYNWLSFIAGAGLVFSYSPYGLWYLPLFLLPLWLFSLTKSAHSYCQSAFAFGAGWFIVGISWVHISMSNFGGMPLIASFGLMALLSLYLALYPTIACWFSQKCSPKQNINLWLLPFFWLISEYLRETILTGFPWLSLGYSQIDGPLKHLAPVIGEIGISYVLLMIAVAFVKLYQQQQIKLAAGVLLTIGLSVVVSANINWAIPTGKTVNTALVQGNVAQDLKWLPEKEQPTMALYLSLSEQAKGADIIVWPESAIPAIEPSIQPYLKNVNDIAANQESAIITGIINYDYLDKAFYNNLIVLGKRTPDAQFGHYFYGHENRFSKHHLLPIGEFVPFAALLRPIAPFFNLPMSSFSRGNIQQAPLIANGINVLPLICFEIAFPDQLAANYHAQTQLLLTVSNDAWFADSIGPHQHMEIARMRALEFARPLVRSTNTGITAAIDHHGEFINQLPQFTQAVLRSTIPLVSGNTLYSQYGRTPIYLIALLFSLFIITRNKRITKR